jgi:hypothetical protein
MPPKGKQSAVSTASRQPTVSPDRDDEDNPQEEPSSTAVARNQTPRAMERRPPDLSEADISSIAAMVTPILSRLVDEALSRRLPPLPIINSTMNTAQGAPSAEPETPPPAPPDSYAPATLPPLKPEDVGLFHPWDDTMNEAVIVTEGKHTIYKDVFAFTDRLKQLAIDDYNEARICRLWTKCLRGDALQWYSWELTDMERRLLSTTTDFELVRQTLIKRFQLQPSVALNKLTAGKFYFNGNRDLRQHCLSRLRYSRHADFQSTHQQLLCVWNTLDGQTKLLLGVPPDSRTTRAQFVQAINTKWPILQEIRQTKDPPSKAKDSLSQEISQSAGQSAGAYSPYSPSKPYRQYKPIENKAFHATEDENGQDDDQID